MERFRGGLVFKAHRLLNHSTLGSKAIKKEEGTQKHKAPRGDEPSGPHGVLRCAPKSSACTEAIQLHDVARVAKSNRSRTNHSTSKRLYWRNTLVQKGLPAPPMAFSRLPFSPVLIPPSLVAAHVQFLPGSVNWRAEEVRLACLVHHFASPCRSVSIRETWATPPLPSATRRSSSND